MFVNEHTIDCAVRSFSLACPRWWCPWLDFTDWALLLALAVRAIPDISSYVFVFWAVLSGAKSSRLLSRLKNAALVGQVF